MFLAFEPWDFCAETFTLRGRDDKLSFCGSEKGLEISLLVLGSGVMFKMLMCSSCGGVGAFAPLNLHSQTPRFDRLEFSVKQ